MVKFTDERSVPGYGPDRSRWERLTPDPPGLDGSRLRRWLRRGAIVAVVAAVCGFALLLLPHASLADPQPVSAGTSSLTVPVVFVSRQHAETLDGTHVGPPVEILGREVVVGGRLLVLHPDGQVMDLTAGTPIMDVQRPTVSFDGTKVVFSGVKSAEEQWHIYEINLDSTGFRQLTFDDRDIPIPVDLKAPRRNVRRFHRYGDFSPAYLPDGRIIFTSTRYMGQSGSCGQRTQNLYVMNADGSGLHRVTTERAGAMDPWVLHDGRVIFSFWADNVNTPALAGPGLRPLEPDRNFASSSWSLWAIHPDGTGLTRYAFLRGGLEDGGGAFQARELPNGNIVYTFRSNASLLGHTLPTGIARLTPGLVEENSVQGIGNPYDLDAPHALGPSPLPDGRILFAYTPDATVYTDWKGRTTADFDYGIYVVDPGAKEMTLVYDAPGTDELDPVAVYPRTAEVIPDIPEAELISDDPTMYLGTTVTLKNFNVYADLPLDEMEELSPLLGTVVAVDFYEDSQTWTTNDEFPLLRKQMPRLIKSVPVNPDGSFEAVVPADRPIFWLLRTATGVVAHYPYSPARPERPGRTGTPFVPAHDFFRPEQEVHCVGCHRGHMIDSQLAMTSARTNLARRATASASSEVRPFTNGTWRVNDQRLSDEEGRFAWATTGETNPWVQLHWPMEIRADQVVLYPLTAADNTRITAATLSFSDGTSVPTGPLPDDGSPVAIAFGQKAITWVRFTVDEGEGRFLGLAEMVVNGPADVTFPDTPPAAPTGLRSTDGVLLLTWDRNTDANLAGYKIYYGTAPGDYTDVLDVGNVGHFIMRELEDGVTYYIALKAYNVYGTESEGFSNEVSGTVQAPVVESIEPDHGPATGGTEVTVHGRNFAPRGIRVKIGHEWARGVQVIDENTIRAVTYRHPVGTYDVVVFNPDDVSGVLAEGFTYERPERE